MLIKLQKRVCRPIGPTLTASLETLACRQNGTRDWNYAKNIFSEQKFVIIFNFNV